MIGCASKPSVITSVEVVKVPVVVTQKCVAAADVPKLPRTAFRKGASLDQNAAAADADIRNLDAYAQDADAVLQKCVTN